MMILTVIKNMIMREGKKGIMIRNLIEKNKKNFFKNYLHKNIRKKK